MKKDHISILGGGMAGLGAAYYAHKMRLPCKVYEAGDHAGGNCITYKEGEFRFDSGAHRLHDMDPEITAELKTLLGPTLREIKIPSQIYYNCNFIDFPLSPLDLMGGLGIGTFINGAFEILKERFRNTPEANNFEEVVVNKYGRIIASRFLLNYSEKLWGVSASNLSSEIAGKRLKGLDIRTFVKEIFYGDKEKTKHLEGSSFYYPELGIGVIPDEIVKYCGNHTFKLNSRVTKIRHKHSRIETFEINGRETVTPVKVISTLPLNTFIKLMEPKPPEKIIQKSEGLRYRNLILVAFFLNTRSVTDKRVATTYFPSAKFPFTRIYEPKNRSASMSPPGKTSLVAEIPCQEEDAVWTMSDFGLLEMIRSHLGEIGWLNPHLILGARVKRLFCAYPVLSTGSAKNVDAVKKYLVHFENLRISGRNGRFVYSWIHDMMRFGKDIVEGFNNGQT